MTGRFLLKRPGSACSELSRSSSIIAAISGATGPSTLAPPAAASTSASSSSTSSGSGGTDLFVSPENALPSFCTTKEGEKDLGCPHYRTMCKIRAECCGTWYPCRLCHDEGETHHIDRFSIRHMLCLLCSTPQPAGQHCVACQRAMARYYCDACHLWDDDPNKAIFHCAKCGICRKGRRENYTHCDRCGGCINSHQFSGHKCREGSLQSDCPICNENLFTSTSPSQFMLCGHAIHFVCLQDYVRNSYQCPICLKSILDTSNYFKCIEETLATQQMPDEYKNFKSLILCNDCERKSMAPFHFIYHKCAHCGSYNTKPIERYNDEGRPLDA